MTLHIKLEKKVCYFIILVFVLGLFIPTTMFSNLEAKQNKNEVKSEEFNFKVHIPENWVFKKFPTPEDWMSKKFPKLVVYGIAGDLESAKKNGYGTNLNLVIERYNSSEFDLEKQIELLKKNVAVSYPSAEMTIEENFILKSNPAFKRQYKYHTQKGQSLVIYQTTVVDEKNETMYHLTFTTLEKEFKKSKPLFDKTLNSFDLLK